MPSRSLFLTAALAAALAPGPGRAQDQPAAVPAPLVVALLGSGALRDDAPRLVVGRPPDGVAAELLPPAPVTVVGGAATRRSRTVVLAYSQPAEQALAGYLALLERGGWARLDTDGMQGGFVGPSTGYEHLCRAGDGVTVRSAPGAPNGSHVVATFYGDARRGACGMERPPRPFLDLPFPTLRGPVGAQGYPTGGSSGESERSMSTRLTTAVGPAELVAHYGAQLEAAGWRVGAPIAGAGLAARPVETRDERGRRWTGALQAIEVGGERDVTLRMVRATERDQRD